MSLLLRAMLVAACLIAPRSHADNFRFVVLGDAPYGTPVEVYPPYEALIDAINTTEPALVIHVGDTKTSATLCSDAVLDDQLAFLMRFEAPTLYTPGDNEWTDCHGARSGGFDPLGRLDYIRRTYFADPATSFGRAPIAVAHQGPDGYPENVRVRIGDVMFVTVHVVGSNNNFEPRSPENVAEFFARTEAGIDWLEDSFSEAGDAAAVVVAIHADMFEFDYAERRETFLRQSGFGAFADALRQEAGFFEGPVLLTFGDSHRFRYFRPFPETAPNVMALETFGAGDMHAVEVMVDTEAAWPFAVRPLINPARPLAGN